MKAIKTFFTKFGNDWTMNLAGMVTYSLITTIFPILLAMLSVAGIVLNFASPGTLHHIAVNLQTSLPRQLQSVIDMPKLLANLVKLTGPLALVSLVGLLWAGSNLFTNIENAFSVIFRVKDREFLPQRLMAIGMVLILSILLPASLGASALVTAGSTAFQAILPQPLGVLLSIVGPVTSIAILWALFLIIYKVVPNITVPFRDAWRGALVAAILFGGFQLLFPTYFKVFLSGNAKYGALAGAVLVMIVWLWFFAVITLIGAQVNAVAMGLKPTRYDLARTLAADYEASNAGQPKRRRAVPDAVHPARLQPAAGAAARIAAVPLRLLALLAWLAARPLVRDEARAKKRVSQ